MDNGKLYMQDDDGKVYPLGEIKDISAEEAEPSEEDKKIIELMKMPSSFSGTLTLEPYAIIYVWLPTKGKNYYGINSSISITSLEFTIHTLAARHETIIRIPNNKAKKIAKSASLRGFISNKYKQYLSLDMISQYAFCPAKNIDGAVIYVVKLRR